jgi:hypothetical protein
MAQLDMACSAFTTTARMAPDIDHISKFDPTVYHANGISLMKFEYNCKKSRADAHKTIARYMQTPPLCKKTEVEPFSQAFDARDKVGWHDDA